MNLRIKNIKLLVIVSISFLLLQYCKRDNKIIKDTPCSINLKWNKAYFNESKEKIEIGLKWGLSFLGASLTKGSFNNATTFQNNIIEIDFSKVGFDSRALSKIVQLLNELKSSDEYKTNNCIDIGRFIMLTINSSNHYYAIVGAKKTLNEFKLNRQYDDKLSAITNSSISFNNRIILMPDTDKIDYTNTSYVSSELLNNISSAGTKVVESEVTELLANGQFAFGIYDSNLRLIPSSKGNAGKISKCMWCHEINIQTLFKPQQEVQNYYNETETKRLILERMKLVNNYRASLNSDIDFSKIYDHTFMELLYITFMEPNVERLSNEWNMSVENVKEKTKYLKKHENLEFSFLGNELFERRDVDSIAPFKSVRVPDSARENAYYEPNLISY